MNSIAHAHPKYLLIYALYKHVFSYMNLHLRVILTFAIEEYLEPKNLI